MCFRATNHPNYGPRQRFHPFSDTCNLQLEHATPSVITAFPGILIVQIGSATFGTRLHVLKCRNFQNTE